MRSKSSPTDPVSEADLSSQRAIRELIAARRPEDAFLGEEEGAEEHGSSGLRWVVDPLDGTVNFLYAIPQWSVSIAVLDEAGPLVGVIHNPVSGETFSAVRGERSRLGARALEPRGERSPPLAQALLCTGFAYDPALRAEHGRLIARLLPRIRDVRRFGSAALDLAWTAMGRCDAYYERGLRPWDTAAGLLVCAGVGLRCAEVDRGLLVAPPALFEQLAELILGGARSAS